MEVLRDSRKGKGGGNFCIYSCKCLCRCVYLKITHIHVYVCISRNTFLYMSVDLKYTKIQFSAHRLQPCSTINPVGFEIPPPTTLIGK